jgi:nucleotide-binding universal stress UspA family protein
MENKNEPILVTWDFTTVSEWALEHAIRISRTTNNGISLLHIIPPKCPEKEKETKVEHMELVCTATEKRFGIRPSIIVIEGSIFRDIAKYATDSNASMVVMGTHGIKGSQKFFGSWALKVIVGSSAPFIVVQDKPETHEKYSNIVLPIDFKSENKEKLSWAIYFGKYFQSKVHLYKYPVTDSSLKRKVEANLNFAIRFLRQNNLNYEIYSPPKSNDFLKETVEFSQQINADLILIMTTKYITIFDYMFGAREQRIIANSAKIPIMCINPKVNFAGVGQFMYGQ